MSSESNLMNVIVVCLDSSDKEHSRPNYRSIQNRDTTDYKKKTQDRQFQPNTPSLNTLPVSDCPLPPTSTSCTRRPISPSPPTDRSIAVSNSSVGLEFAALAENWKLCMGGGEDDVVVVVRSPSRLEEGCKF